MMIIFIFLFFSSCYKYLSIIKISGIKLRAGIFFRRHNATPRYPMKSAVQMVLSVNKGIEKCSRLKPRDTPPPPHNSEGQSGAGL